MTSLSDEQRRERDRERQKRSRELRRSGGMFLAPLACSVDFLIALEVAGLAPAGIDTPDQLAAAVARLHSLFASRYADEIDALSQCDRRRPELVVDNES